MTLRIYLLTLLSGIWTSTSHSAQLNIALSSWWEEPLTVQFGGWTGRGGMVLLYEYRSSTLNAKHTFEHQTVQWESFYDHLEPRHAGHQPYEWGVRYVLPAYLSADLMNRTGKNKEKWLNRLTGIAIAVGLQYSLTHPIVTIHLEPWFHGDAQGIAVNATF